MIANPHDGLVKLTFGQVEHARGELRAIVPPAVSEALHWSTLAVQPGSFVDAALAHQHTDLLYSLTWRGGRDALVYLLFEHQSAPPTDGLMGRRLLRYMDRIWERWSADHSRAKRLPMIVPIVLYHGAAQWPEPVAFEDLLDVPAELRPGIDPHLIRFTYVLYDLSHVSDEELRASVVRTARGKLTTLLLKHGRTDADLLRTLARWMDLVRDVVRAPHGLDALGALLRYIFEVNEHIQRDELQRLLEREIGPQAKDVMMTIGQQLRQEGRQEALLLLLRQRFPDAITPQIEQRVAAAPGALRDVWTSRVLSAAPRADLLGDCSAARPPALAAVTFEIGRKLGRATLGGSTSVRA